LSAIDSIIKEDVPQRYWFATVFLIAETAGSDTNIALKRHVFVTFAIIGLAFFHQSALAWGGASHQLIAAEAYRQLSPELKAEVNEVLKAQYAMD
jgi:hypothetical protein